MNKRQRKKQCKPVREKVKAVVSVDLTNVTDNRQIDIYISNKYETENPTGGYIENDIQNRYVDAGKILRKSYTHVLNIFNHYHKTFTLTVWVSESEKSYYVIRQKQTEMNVNE